MSRDEYLRNEMNFAIKLEALEKVINALAMKGGH